VILALEETFTVGQDTCFDSISPTSSFGVTFEEDLTTGYFYAVNTKPQLRILDALHVYNVADVIEKDKPFKIQFAWSDDGQVASLLINNFCHAIFDFKARVGYCRNGFQESNGDWCRTKERTLTNELIYNLFKVRK
jgi:hypothetical protein